MNLVPKADGKWRKIVNSSWKKLGSRQDVLGGVPLTPNLHAHAFRVGIFDWCSREKIMQAK